MRDDQLDTTRTTIPRREPGAPAIEGLPRPRSVSRTSGWPVAPWIRRHRRDWAHDEHSGRTRYGGRPRPRRMTRRRLIEYSSFKQDLLGLSLEKKSAHRPIRTEDFVQRTTIEPRRHMSDRRASERSTLESWSDPSSEDPIMGPTSCGVEQSRRSKARHRVCRSSSAKPPLSQFHLFLRFFQTQSGLFPQQLDRLDLSTLEHQRLDGIRRSRTRAVRRHGDLVVATEPGHGQHEDNENTGCEKIGRHIARFR